MSDLRFDDRVVIVTGAGGGLGKAYALFFAARGAKVVVNDLGTGKGGEGTAARPAQQVVDEIKAAGGQAIANFDSVEFGDKIVKTAMDTWGRVDVVINNAGILRDTSFVKMRDQDFDIIYRVHLKGSYSVSKAAWPIMREQKFGRIIMTTSAAGLYGNFGQANYSAAKLGILGLANTLAIEGKSRNIRVNTIAPLAGTRLTETVMPPDLVKALKPEYIAPLVGFLTHEQSDVTGRIFEVGAGWMSSVRRERSPGHFFSSQRPLTAEDIRNNWDRIVDFSKDTSFPTSPQDSIGLIMSQIEASKAITPPPTPKPDMRFDGRVVVVTGAGGGLGRTYALLFGSRGAKVVVNDLGTGTDGTGSGNRPAEKVVEEIKAAGGEAVANFDSVEFGDKIIKTAMDTWGRVDIVINNAGILRDVSFVKMKDREFDLVNAVHLKGSYSVSKAAWNVMREQKFGRIIMTTSAAGLYGNFGQANYSAAKLGILGLANTLAIEGAKRNIRVNTIAPVAGTRMTATVMPPDLVKVLKPDYVAPLVMYLCHETTEATGGVFEVGAGWVSALRWQRGYGKFFNPAKPTTPEEVKANWAQIEDCSNNPTNPTSPSESVGVIMAHLEQSKSAAPEPAKAAAGNENVNPSKILAHKFRSLPFSFEAKDAALYALAVGAAKDPLDEDELKFVYENSPNFAALPTLGIVFPFEVLGDVLSIDGLKFNPMMLLHGEQYLEILKPIPTSGELSSSAKVAAIYDKGKGAVLKIDAITKDKSGTEICKNQFTIFIRGIGGFGGDRGPTVDPKANAPPSRAPDAVHTDTTQDNQALFYRFASGDLNPLHADPSMAAMGNFPKPILHGMCTFGYAGRAVLKHFCNNDPTKFKAIKARMASHVFPGETIQTEMWKVSESKIAFRCSVKERKKVVISQAYVEIVPSAAPASSASSSSNSASGFKSAKIFTDIEKKLAVMGAQAVKQVNGIYLFKVTGGPGGATQSWTVDLKNGNGSVASGAQGKADCTITMSDDDLVALFAGELNPQQAFMGGRLKISGNMALAMKLEVLTKGQSKL